MKHDVDEVFREWGREIAAGRVPEGTTVETLVIPAPKPEKYRLITPDGVTYEFEAIETALGLKIVGDVKTLP